MIRVLIVDDSVYVQESISGICSKDPEIKVIEVLSDPTIEVEKIKQLRPDVIVIGLEFSKMNCLAFIKNVMSTIPTPIIIVSSRTKMGSETAVKAIQLGAVAVVAKPLGTLNDELNRTQQNIIDAIKSAVDRKSRGTNIHTSQIKINDYQQRLQKPNGSTFSKPISNTDPMIVIGASTGGTVAVREILQKLPANFPSVFIILHMPPGFTKSFADGLNRDCTINVKEIEDQEIIRRGYAYIAPGAKHTTVIKGENNFYFALDDDPPINRFKPSIDKAFFSVAKIANHNTIGVILTGMGRDGAEGLKAMKDKGAYTLAQDEKTSVVYGMPKRAAEIGAVHEILPIDQIADAIIRKVEGK